MPQDGPMTKKALEFIARYEPMLSEPEPDTTLFSQLVTVVGAKSEEAADLYKVSMDRNASNFIMNDREKAHIYMCEFFSKCVKFYQDSFGPIEGTDQFLATAENHLRDLDSNDYKGNIEAVGAEAEAAIADVQTPMVDLFKEKDGPSSFGPEFDALPESIKAQFVEGMMPIFQEMLKAELLKNLPKNT
jgi:hypothetical protein